MLIQASGTFIIAYPSIQLEDQGTPWKYLHIFPYYLNIFTYIIIYLHTEPLNHCILYILHMVPCIANRRHPSKKKHVQSEMSSSATQFPKQSHEPFNTTILCAALVGNSVLRPH